MDGQVSGLGTVHPLLTLSFVSTCCVFNIEEEVVVIRNGWTPKKEKKKDICKAAHDQFTGCSLPAIPS